MAPVSIERDLHSCFHSEYAEAIVTVQEWYQNARDDDERNCAIMWQLLLHRILFRTRNPDRGGERANRTTCCAYSKRLGLFRDEQFHALVHAFLKDADAAQERSTRRSSADDASTLRKALSLVQVGECGKAASLLTSAGLGDTADARVLAQLECKFPHRTTDIDEFDYSQAVDYKLDLTTTYRSLDRHSAPDPDGLPKAPYVRS